ncbi:response regulator [bacterium]|nr:response regulator [bacterium]
MKSRKVLIVDDEQFILNLITELLEAYDYQVMTAKNGRAALELLSKELPDIIVSDIMMPEMDGFTFLQKLQENSVTRHIPFLFLSAKSQVDDRVRGLQDGADDYICKPFDHDEFLARLEVRLNKKNNLLFAETTHTSEIKGDIAVFSLVDLIQMIKMRNLTGELKLDFVNEKAILRFYEGKLSQIEYKGLPPLKAFQFLMDRRQGHFSFYSSNEQYQDEIMLDTEHFLLEAMKQYDDYQRLVSELPPLHQVWLRSTMDLKGRRMSKVAQKVLQQFDGIKSIQDIIEAVSDDDQVVLKIIRDLIKNGFLQQVGSVTDNEGPPDMTREDLSDKDQCKDALKSLIEYHSGNASLVVVGDQEESLNTYIQTLSSCLGVEEGTCTTSSNSFSLKKTMLDDIHAMNIYGVTRLEQFNFLNKIMLKEILGFLFLVNGPGDLTPDHLVHECVQQAKRELMHYLLVSTMSADIQKADPFFNMGDVITCQIDDRDSVLTTFNELLHKCLA